MAIYQFSLYPVPLKGIIHKYGEIPNSLPVDRSKGYLEIKEIGEAWELSKTEPDATIKRLDELLDRSNRGNSALTHNWKTYASKVDNDAFLSVNPTTGFIEELTLRADLRENGLTFLTEIIGLSEDLEYYLCDSKGNLIKPNLEAIFALLQESNSLEFLTDQRAFLNWIKNK